MKMVIRKGRCQIVLWDPCRLGRLEWRSCMCIIPKSVCGLNWSCLRSQKLEEEQ